jgi:Fe(3+) dicitrate transport protein
VATGLRVAIGVLGLSSGLAAVLNCQSPNGSIQGRLTDSGRVSRQVGAVRIELQGTKLRTTTDSTGRFSFTGVPAATYLLIVGPQNGVSLRREVRVQPGAVVDISLDLREGVPTLEPLVVTAARPLHVIGHLPDLRDNVIYAGKKSEVITLDSLHANLAQDIERQILGRIPGAHFSETAAAGFPSNGVGFRGLNPTQSIEMNTRQNGVNIAADLFGYPETYYAPPSEALDRIEVVRGAGSLAFGPQFGGTINYVMRTGALRSRPLLSANLTTGSFGLLNGFSSVAGGTSRSTYYAFANYRSESGWRPNSDFRQITVYGSATVHPSDGLTLGFEYTFFRNRIHMPGGLSDAEFAASPRQSFRARNWLASPWNVAAARLQYRFSPTARWETVLSYLAGDRHLVWRNEDGGPQALDTIDPETGTLVPREVEREIFHNGTLESRLSFEHRPLGRPVTTAVGVRLGVNHMQRFEGGPGSTGSNFDMKLYGGTWERALRFETTNAAAFVESVVHASDRLSITPGIRFEYVRSKAFGYTDVASSFAPRSLGYPLLGVGAQFITGASTALYANISQAYRPVLYASLTPFGSIARIDPSLHSSRGFNADFGWRGTVAEMVKVDLGAFYLHYGDRAGIRTVDDGAGGTFLETSNIGDSRHRGVEAYVEFDPPGLRGVDLFTSFAYVDARYTSGSFSGNRVEQAPRVLDRSGITYARGRLASTLQLSHSASSYGDANNSVVPTDDAAAGFVPGYTVLDWSGQFQLGRKVELSVGINNLANTRYFTKRTDEYPGPGILPGIGRSVYVTVESRF